MMDRGPQQGLPVEEYPVPEDDDGLIDHYHGLRGEGEPRDDGDVRLLQAAPVQAEHRWVLPEVPAFLYFISLVTQSPVVTFWLFNHYSHQYSFDASNRTLLDYCSPNASGASNASLVEQQVQEATNTLSMYTSFASSFTAIGPALLLGTLTDRLGRKFVLYVGLLGTMASQTIILLILLLDLSPNLLFVSSFLQGLSGSYGLLLASLFGIVADITAKGKRRGLRVAAVEASIAVSASLGLMVSGFWVKKLGYVWPMVAALSETFLAVAYVFFFIPETLRERKHQPLSCKMLANSFQFYVRDTIGRRRFKMVILIVAFLLILVAYIGDSNISMLYLLHRPFCWSQTFITFFGGSFVLVKWLCTVILLAVGKRFISEPVFALIGAVSLTAFYALKGLAQSDLMLFVAYATSTFGELISPMCRTMMSKLVSSDEQGALFAGIGVLQMVTSAVSGILMSNVYNLGLSTFLGLPYLVCTGIMAVTVVLFLVLVIREKLRPGLGQQPWATETTIN